MKHLGKMLVLVLAFALLCGLLCACKKDLPTGETGLPDTGNAAGTEGNGTGPNENPGGNTGTPGENDGNGGGNTGGNGGGTVPSNPGKDTDIVLPEIPFHKK